MALVATGIAICVIELVGLLQEPLGNLGPARASFPVWMRVAGPMLPLVGLWKWNTRIRIGMFALAAVALVEMNGFVWTREVWPRYIAILGAGIMIFSGWTGTPKSSRLAEVKGLAPWIVGFLGFLGGLRVLSWFAGQR